jgi:DHA2 family multidrug resistance protein
MTAHAASKTDVRRADAHGAWYPWIAMGVVLIGTYMVILDTTIVNVALPQIGIDLHSSADIEWIVTAYLLALAVSQPATGWLADRAGRKSVFTITMGAFALGSLLAALSPNLDVLIGMRVFQGLAGGAMMPVGLAMIYELFPADRRGTALGIWGVAAMAAPAVGPLAGGFLVTNVGWRSLFLINVPIGAIGVVAALKLLRDTGYRESRRFDAVGLGLAGSGLALLLLASSEITSWGWRSPLTLGVTAVSIVLLAAFARHALREREPLVDIRIFAQPVFSLTIAIVWVITVAQYARLVFVPIELETLRNMTAFHVGLIMAPAALGAAVTTPIGGWMADRMGPRPPVLIGLAFLGAGMWLLAKLSLDTSELRITAYLLVVSMGTGFANTPNMIAALNTLPARLLSQGTAVRSINRQIAGSFGVAILSSVIVAQIGTVSAISVHGHAAVTAQNAYNLVFLIGLGSIAIAAVLAVFLPSAASHRAYQQERAAEAELME